MFPVKLDRMGRDMRGGFRREEAYGYLWKIHVDVWQKPAQYCKVINPPIKIIIIIKEMKE